MRADEASQSTREGPRRRPRRNWLAEVAFACVLLVGRDSFRNESPRGGGRSRERRVQDDLVGSEAGPCPPSIQRRRPAGPPPPRCLACHPPPWSKLSRQGRQQAQRHAGPNQP